MVFIREEPFMIDVAMAMVTGPRDRVCLLIVVCHNNVVVTSILAGSEIMGGFFRTGLDWDEDKMRTDLSDDTTSGSVNETPQVQIQRKIVEQKHKQQGFSCLLKLKMHCIDIFTQTHSMQRQTGQLVRPSPLVRPFSPSPLVRPLLSQKRTTASRGPSGATALLRGPSGATTLLCPRV